MKILRRFLMFFAPVLILVLAFVFFPEIRPDTSEYRELRREDFMNPIEKSKKSNGTRMVTGTLVQNYFPGKFIVLDIGKLRLAIRTDQATAGSNPYIKAVISHGGFYINQSLDLSVDPPRKVNVPALPKTAKSSGITPVFATSPAPGLVPATANTEIHKLPTGSRIDLGPHVLSVEKGMLTLGETTVSTVEKPVLVVVDGEFKVEFVEELDPDLAPADEIRP